MASLASKCGGVTAAILVLAPIQGTPTAQAQPSPCGDRVVVAIGETLAQIARRCGVTVEAIMAANPLLPSPYFILPGLRIDIPQPARPEPANVIRYRVLPGDTFSSIARAHGVTMAQIFDARTLRPGDIVRIRAGAVPPPAPPAER